MSAENAVWYNPGEDQDVVCISYRAPDCEQQQNVFLTKHTNVICKCFINLFNVSFIT